jgi:organic radical activating enzyme
MKFKYLKIDLESRTTYVCHAAKPHPVNFAWLSKNPGQLFNTDVNIAERNMMLRNERNDSCEQNCWSAEDCGSVSPRMYQGGQARTHTEPATQPEIIDLTIGGDCNLTCSYCCKEFSSAWRRDLADNGEYNVSDNRYQLDSKDRVLLAIGQRDLKATEQYQTLLNEIKSASANLKTLTVTGGEPFLDNQLVDVLKSLNLQSKIEIYSGLGVNIKRFERILNELQDLNILIIVSAESINKLLEFNRYGIAWDDFIAKIALLNSKNIPFKFQATLTNLTVVGFTEFYNYFKNEEIIVTVAHQPSMMAPYVLDKATKDSIVANLPLAVRDIVVAAIAAEPTELQRISIKEFLLEFSRRRNLNLNVFPTTFLTWLEIDRVV